MSAARRPDDFSVMSDEYIAAEMERIAANDARREAEYQADRAAYYRRYPDGPPEPHQYHNPRLGSYARLAED